MRQGLRLRLAPHRRVFAAFFLYAFAIGGFSSLGLPATAGFVAEFLTFVGAFASSHRWWLFPGVIGAFLTSIYVLRVVRRIFWGPPSDDPHFRHLPDARGPEWVALVLLAGFGDPQVRSVMLPAIDDQNDRLREVAYAYFERNPDPTESEVRYWLAGNLCRCTGYDKIVRAVLTAAEGKVTAKA